MKRKKTKRKEKKVETDYSFSSSDDSRSQRHNFDRNVFRYSKCRTERRTK